MTANRFDNAYHFDLIICLGNYTGTRFDCFKCMSAPTIITLLYDFERNIWISRRKKAASFVRLINKRACIPVMEDEEVDQLYAEEDEEEPVQEIAQRIEDTEYYFNRLRARLPELQSYTRNSDVTSKETDIAAVVTFETGEKAFLTPYYEACVYIEKDGVVKEVHINADDLLEGDYMVFTRNDSMMHDIVDDILTMLINNNKLSEDDIVDYNRSKTWKNRLRAYKKLSHYTSGDITERLEKNGVSVTEQTVRIWTDPEAHTVGPRDLKVIRAIGKITSDSEMMTHPEITMNSCRRIRQLRRSILEIIGNTVMDILSGKNMKFIDSSEEEIQSRIRTQADIMRIESFVRVSNKVPSAFVNRPISL